MDILNNFSVLGKSTFKDQVKVQKGAVFSGSEVSFTTGVKFDEAVTFATAPTFSTDVTFDNIAASDIATNTISATGLMSAASADFSGAVTFNNGVSFACAASKALFTSPVEACSIQACTISANSIKIPSIDLSHSEAKTASIKYGSVNYNDNTEWILDLATTDTVNIKAIHDVNLITCAGTVKVSNEGTNVATFEKTSIKFAAPFAGSEITGTAVSAQTLSVANSGTVGGTFAVEQQTQLKSDVSILGKTTISGGLKLEKSTGGTEFLDSDVNIKTPSLSIGNSATFSFDTTENELLINSNGSVKIGASNASLTINTTGELCAEQISTSEFITSNATIEGDLNINSAFLMKASGNAPIFKLTDEDCSSTVLTVAVADADIAPTTEFVAFKSYVDSSISTALKSLEPSDGTYPSKYETVANPSLDANTYTYTAELKNTYQYCPIMQMIDKNGSVKYADLTFVGSTTPQTVTVGLIHEGAINTTEFNLVVFGV